MPAFLTQKSEPVKEIPKVQPRPRVAPTQPKEEVIISSAPKVVVEEK
jgi:hypothetical protein